MIRVGLVDFDTSHVVAFTERLNHVGVAASEWVDDGDVRVVAGCPGDSQMMPERIPGFLEKVRGYGVEIVERPNDLLGRIDAVMIESQQGARHRERARPFLEAGLPTFVDKPFAGTLEDADAMIALSQKHRAPLMSCSALRYAPEVSDALARQNELGKILSADVWGDAPLYEGNPGLLHYGIHGVEVLYTLMGPGCTRVCDVSTPQGEVVLGQWESGHMGVMRGLRDGKGGFGFTVHYERGHHTAIVEGARFYTEMLKAVVALFTSGVSPIDLSVTREILAFIKAAARSADQGGAGTRVETRV